MVLTGHIHRYERSCPVIQEKCVTNGPTHLTVGTAGTDLDGADVLNPPWKVKDYLTWGYLKVEANTTSLRLQFKQNKDRQVLDEFILYQ